MAKDIKILVIGSHGQLARSLLAITPPEPFTMVCASRPETDLTKPETLAQTLADHAPHFVVNAAAYTHVDDAETHEDAAFAVNTHGVEVLASLCAAQQIPLIHVSTDYVYDGAKETAYTESDSTAPIGVYGQSKLAGEEAIRASGCQHIILRTAWVYSPYGNNFVKTMLHVAQSRDELSVVNDQYGCPTYASHLAAGILEIIQTLNDRAISEDVWGTYCMAGSGQSNWHEFAIEIFRQSAKLGGPIATVNPIPTSAYPTRARRPVNSRMNCDKLERAFGVRLPDWHEGTMQCVKKLMVKNT